MRRGLASFEFILVLGIILVVTTAVIAASLEESRDSLIMSAVKTEAMNEMHLHSLESEDCSNPMITNYTVENGNILELEVSPGCYVDPVKVANRVEKEICGVEPTHNQNIECGDKTYRVEIK